VKLILISNERPYVETREREPDINSYARGWSKLSHEDKDVSEAWLKLCKINTMMKSKIIIEDGLYNFKDGIFTKLI